MLGIGRMSSSLARRSLCNNNFLRFDFRFVIIIDIVVGSLSRLLLLLILCVSFVQCTASRSVIVPGSVHHQRCIAINTCVFEPHLIKHVLFHIIHKSLFRNFLHYCTQQREAVTRVQIFLARSIAQWVIPIRIVRIYPVVMVGES